MLPPPLCFKVAGASLFPSWNTGNSYHLENYLLRMEPVVRWSLSRLGLLHIESSCLQ